MDMGIIYAKFFMWIMDTLFERVEDRLYLGFGNWDVERGWWALGFWISAEPYITMRMGK